MPSKKKKYNARFPPARIKKIMQTDDDVGKVAAAVPVIISRALELFIESLILKTSETTQCKNAKTLTTAHIKETVLSEKTFDFLKDLVDSIPDVQTEEEPSASQSMVGEPSNTKPKVPRQRKKEGGRGPGRPRKERKPSQESFADDNSETDEASDDGTDEVTGTTSSAVVWTPPVLPVSGESQVKGQLQSQDGPSTSFPSPNQSSLISADSQAGPSNSLHAPHSKIKPTHSLPDMVPTHKQENLSSRVVEPSSEVNHSSPPQASAVSRLPNPNLLPNSSRFSNKSRVDEPKSEVNHSSPPQARAVSRLPSPNSLPSPPHFSNQSIESPPSLRYPTQNSQFPNINSQANSSTGFPQPKSQVEPAAQPNHSPQLPKPNLQENSSTRFPTPHSSPLTRFSNPHSQANPSVPYPAHMPANPLSRYPMSPYLPGPPIESMAGMMANNFPPSPTMSPGGRMMQDPMRGYMPNPLGNPFYGCVPGMYPQMMPPYPPSAQMFGDPRIHPGMMRFPGMTMPGQHYSHPMVPKTSAFTTPVPSNLISSKAKNSNKEDDDYDS